MDQQTPNPKKTSTGLKIIVLVVLIVLLIIGILLPIKIVPGAVSSIANTLTSLFVPKEKVKLSADKSMVNSGDTFTLSWTGQHKTNGSYALSYECAAGVHLEASVNRPYETLPCNSEYYFSSASNTVQLAASSDQNRYSDVTIALGFLENNALNVDKLGNVTITISNPNVGASTTATSTASSTPTPTPKPKPKVTASPRPVTVRPVSNPNGLADLETRIMATGYLSSTGAFVPSTTVDPTSQAAVRFAIVNVGNKNTGPWTFSADLPSATDARYISVPQQNLGPGDRIVYTLGFNNILPQGGFVQITADPGNLIPEYSKTNNTARVRFVVTGQGTVVPGTLPDFTVRITATGVIDRSTNVFTPTNTVNASDRVGIRFEVQNIGGTASPSWIFRAQLPSSDTSSSNYYSGTQTGLNPGEKAIFTLGFDNIQNQGANTATVTIDPSNSISEGNKNNNTATVTIIRN